MNRIDHVDILRFQFPDSCNTNNDNVEFEQPNNSQQIAFTHAQLRIPWPLHFGHVGAQAYQSASQPMSRAD